MKLLVSHKHATFCLISFRLREEEAGMDLPPRRLDFLVGSWNLQMTADRASLTAVSLVEIVALIRVQVVASSLVLDMESIFSCHFLPYFLLGALKAPVVINVAFTKFSVPCNFLSLWQSTFIVSVRVQVLLCIDMLQSDSLSAGDRDSGAAGVLAFVEFGLAFFYLPQAVIVVAVFDGGDYLELWAGAEVDIGWVEAKNGD